MFQVGIVRDVTQNKSADTSIQYLGMARNE